MDRLNLSAPTATNARTAAGRATASMQGASAMTTRFTKTITAAVAALTLLGTVAASTQDAQARRWGHGWGPAIGIGIGLSLLGAAAFAASQPVCRLVPVYDRFGNYVGSREVCPVPY
jgi:hypothetical protein